MALGSVGAFLVLEEQEHAKRRGARILARLSSVMADRTPRPSGAVTTSLRRMWQQLRSAPRNDQRAIISGASGAEPATAEERAFLAEHPQVPVRATGTYIGHAMEPQFPLNIALAALAIARGKLFPADGSGIERPFSGAPNQVVVTGVGHWRGEGMALLEAPV